MTQPNENDDNGNGNNKAMQAIVENGTIDSDELREMIDNGLDVNHQNDEGQTLLMLMAELDEANVEPSDVELLIENDANIDLEDNQGRSALDYALHELDNGIALILLNEGAVMEDDILFEVFDELRDRPSIHADVFRAMIDKGADPTVQRDGKTVFIELANWMTNAYDDEVVAVFDSFISAIKSDNPEMLPSILDVSFEGKTALDILSTVPEHALAIVEGLLEEGASLGNVRFDPDFPEYEELLSKYRTTSSTSTPAPKQTRQSRPVEPRAPAPAASSSSSNCDDDNEEKEEKGKDGKEGTCPVPIKSGARKGEPCGLPGKFGGFCGKHKTK